MKDIELEFMADELMVVQMVREGWYYNWITHWMETLGMGSYRITYLDKKNDK